MHKDKAETVESSESAGGSAATGRTRSGRKTRSPKKAEELFARLRAADEEGSPAEVTASGAAVVVGLAAVEPDASAGGAPETSEPGSSGAADAEATGAADPDRVALHTRDALLAPTVRVMYDGKRMHYLPPEDLDLSRPAAGDQIVAYESPEKYAIDLSHFLH